MNRHASTLRSFPRSAWECPVRRSAARARFAHALVGFWIRLAVLLVVVLTPQMAVCTDAAQQPVAQEHGQEDTGTHAAPPLTSQPQEPTEALKSFALPDGFRIELMAAEPLVRDPVAIQWGADGKLWVAEMADYPYGLDGKMSPGGRVRVLEDTDGDGKPDRSTVFLDHINFPTGVLPWRKGTLVTAAPEIFYAEDTDGDGKADLRKTLFTGFKEGNPQLRVNGLQWGLDGWVYCANGWSGGEVHCLRTGKTIDLKRYDFRFRPDTGELELISGITEFGRNRDDWGNWFGCDNSNPAWHFVLDDRYLRRNPYVSSPDARKQLLPPNPHVFARSQLQKRYHSFEHADRFTSACAVTPYRDELLFDDPGAPGQHLFVCEPVHNLVQHLRLTPNASSFVAELPEHREQRDFLTSTDPWFRPVNLRTGPDGALWVVDMYRYMIEHPEWLPDEGKRELEPHFRAGEDRGRIYRIFHEDRPPRRWNSISTENSETLYSALESPNGWQRDIAEQALVWRISDDRDYDATATRLKAIAHDATKPKSRLQALHTLGLLDRVDREDLLRGLRDDHPAVRRAAVRMSEELTDDVALLDEVARLATDMSASVRLQVACTLGAYANPKAADALARILASGDRDPYITAGIFSSLRKDNIDPCFRTAILGANSDQQTSRKTIELVSLCTALGRNELVLELFAGMEPGASGYRVWQIDAAEHWLRDRNHPKVDQAQSAAAKTNRAESVDSDSKQTAMRNVEHLLAWARQRAADPSADAALRAACLRISLRNAPSRDAAVALALAALELQTPQDLQRIAVQELAAFNTADAGARLLDRWRSYSPSVRQEMLAAVLPRPALIEELLSRLEQGAIRPGEIDAPSRQRLLNSKSDQFRHRAKLVFGEPATGDRQAVVRDFQSISDLAADVARGRVVFAQKCAACHAVEGQGHAVGPNLEALSDRSTQGLLAAILDPSRAIEPKYAVYQAVTRDGRSYTGILAAETSGQIELVEQEDRRHVIPRSELEELSSSDKSLMPEGFEKDLSRQQLADLIAYLQKPLANTHIAQ